ncbi:NADPH oxidase [Fusarium beomiforme]|uniref:NADPH oxidase n=1 Tax=Fusarium beomiforme TaxID=44412 RepID=A0A9P5DLH3_9HYPO|nr:NADPH oxidase [Fusarium beomiforme]
MPVWSSPDQYVKGEASDLTFLVSRTSGHHRRSLGSIFPDSRLRLDGPYGKDLKLHTFETVVLTAKGLGISGVLPFALHLAARRRHDNGLRDKSARLRDSSEPVFGDLSRNVDLIWWLEHDDQDRYNFGFDEFSRELRQEARYPGRTIVVASGDEKFVNIMRRMVVQNTTSKRFIEFADVEYHTQPGGFKSSFYNLPDSQAALVNSNPPSGSQSTPIEMIEVNGMDISDQYANKIKEFV